MTTPSRARMQRNYYEHVIRDETDRHSIRRYMEANPCMWADDDENPLRQGEVPGLRAV